MDALQIAVKYYKPIAQITHRQVVCRMYRQALREAFNWAESRKLFLEEASVIRARFDANKSLDADSPLVARILQETEAELIECSHPDPYLNPHMPGGSSFMRNPAMPLEFVYPSGIPEHYVQRKLNIDMSNLAPGQTYANKVFVDSVNKKYWIDK